MKYYNNIIITMGVIMLKKTIISIIAISLLGSVIYFNKENIQELKSPTISIAPVVKENRQLQQKNSEKIILIKRNYGRSLEFLENMKLIKKEKFRAIIAEIRDLGFEIDENDETVSIIKLTSQEPELRPDGSYYAFEIMDYSKLMDLNKYSDNIYSLKFENPIGSDFIVDYKKIIDDSDLSMIGSSENIIVKMENNKHIKNQSMFLYYGGRLEFSINFEKSEVMDDLTFIYEKTRNEKSLRINIDSKTGKKIESYNDPNHLSLEPVYNEYKGK